MQVKETTMDALGGSEEEREETIRGRAERKYGWPARSDMWSPLYRAVAKAFIPGATDRPGARELADMLKPADSPPPMSIQDDTAVIKYLLSRHLKGLPEELRRFAGRNALYIWNYIYIWNSLSLYIYIYI
jgi:hypothetical protein